MKIKSPGTTTPRAINLKGLFHKGLGASKADAIRREFSVRVSLGDFFQKTLGEFHFLPLALGIAPEMLNCLDFIHPLSLATNEIQKASRAGNAVKCNSGKLVGESWTFYGDGL